MKSERVKKVQSQSRPHLLGDADRQDDCPPVVSATLTEHVYRTARAVHEAKAAVADLISRLSGGPCGGDECVAKSGGVIADAALHAEEAEELVRLVHELTALIGAK